jgi:asparagine synthase (glutamine-hydrolysing)
MNLFVCLWNAPQDWRIAALDAVKGMSSVLPQLSADTAAQLYPSGRSASDTNGGPLVVAMRTSDTALGGRTYSAMDGSHLVMYDGVAVDPGGHIAAHSSDDLARHWDELLDRLEGQFVVARASPRSLEVITDPLGLYPVYYWQRDRTWLVSNSVAVLRAITGERSWDPVGLCSDAVAGWTMDDRTLTANIRVMPGGHAWSIGSDASLTKRKYFDRAELARLSRAANNRPDTPALLRTIQSILRHASGRGGQLVCALTAGRDTRLLAAVLKSEQLSAQYVTGGDLDSEEVSGATRVAEAYGLDHIVEDCSLEAIVDRWSDLAWRIVRENDGLVNVWQAHNLAYTPTSVTSLNTFLWGIGGEICRSFYGVPLLNWAGANVEEVVLRVTRLNLPQPIARPTAQAATLDQVRAFVREATDEGFPADDLLDVFFTYERLRRWAGANLRKYSPTAEVVTPFCTRPYMRASFQFDALHRWTEPMHYQMLRMLDRRLHRMPFQSGQRGWKSRNAVWNWRQQQMWTTIKPRLPWRIQKLFQKQSPYHQISWLEAHLPLVRQICLDGPSDDLWSVLDRERLEALLARENTDGRRRAGDPLFRAVTLCFARAADVAP